MQEDKVAAERATGVCAGHRRGEFLKPERRHPDKEAPSAKAPTRRLGATMGATRTNDFAILRTSPDNRHESPEITN